jgi:hypothetical protein
MTERKRPPEIVVTPPPLTIELPSHGPGLVSQGGPASFPSLTELSRVHRVEKRLRETSGDSYIARVTLQ